MKAYWNFDEYLADQASRNQNVIRTLRVKVRKRSDIDEKAFGAFLREAAR